MKTQLKKIRSFLADIYYVSSWIFLSNRKKKRCLNQAARAEKIVVSLTSFPGRIHIVHKTIKTILNQKKIKPDIVELWLAEEQFPNKESDLPIELIELKRYGLSISWCKDIKSYKKLVPALKKYNNFIIVTTDDDVYYSKDWLEKLYFAYQSDKKNIYCHRVTKFYQKDSEFKIQGGGKAYYTEPSYLNKLVGVGGVLYPPNSLSPDVINDEMFLKIAPTNDDIWFWFMAIKKGVKISIVPHNEPRPIDVYKSEYTEKLTNINDHGEELFWQQFTNLLKTYANIHNILLSESERVGSL